VEIDRGGVSVTGISELSWFLAARFANTVVCAILLKAEWKLEIEAVAAE
jgi:hypothetical protein